MKSLRTVKEVQSLTEKLAVLNRFILRAIDKCHHFFQTIKKERKMEWTSECEKAFGQLKEYLAHAPLLSTPREGDQLYLYLAVSKWATSLVLVREVEGKQHLVYYTSKALVDAETRPTDGEMGTRFNNGRTQAQTIFSASSASALKTRCIWSISEIICGAERIQPILQTPRSNQSPSLG